MFPDHDRSTEADSIWSLEKKIIWSLVGIGGTIGIVVGAVFGSVAALAVAGILVWWTCREKRCHTKGAEGKCFIHVLLSNEH